MENVVSDIDDVVDRTQTYQAQLILQPFRTFLYGYTLDCYTGITRASFHVFDFNINVKFIVFYLESINRRTL